VETARDFLPLLSHFASCPAATSKHHLTTRAKHHLHPDHRHQLVCTRLPIPPPASDSIVRLTPSTPPPSPSAPVKLTSPNARVPHLSSLRAVKIINNSPATTQPRRNQPSTPLHRDPHRVSPYTRRIRRRQRRKDRTRQSFGNPGANGGNTPSGNIDSVR